MQPLFLVQPAQIQLEPSPVPPPAATAGSALWMVTACGFALATVAIGVYAKIRIDKLNKTIKFEEYRSTSLDRRLKLALKTIQKMERNPDLVYSREFNLDYLRLRMEEPQFRNVILNQVRVSVKQLLSQNLRADIATNTSTGVASTGGRKIDCIFDIVYDTNKNGQRAKGVLFRLHVKLTKLPTQATSVTVDEVLECILRFIHPEGDEFRNWQPTLQGRVVTMFWDQNARPTPLLIFEQTNQGANVSFRSTPSQRRASASVIH